MNDLGELPVNVTRLRQKQQLWTTRTVLFNHM